MPRDHADTTRKCRPWRFNAGYTLKGEKCDFLTGERETYREAIAEDDDRESIYDMMVMRGTA